MSRRPYPDPPGLAIAGARPRILVIKLGALGDFIHALPAFAAIRAHHAGDEVVLLTTAPFATLAKAAPWFDDIRIDERAPWWDLAALGRTRRALRGFDFVYDLQTSRRSSRYFQLAGRPPWSGIAAGCSHPHANPDRDRMHTLERQREQLASVGITQWPVPDRRWLASGGQMHGVSGRYGLLMPGGAGLGGVKRWPLANYLQAAQRLHGVGVTPVVVGAGPEVAMGRAILQACPAAQDLTGQTSIADLAALAMQAAVALGNDTGPVHLAAALGAPTVVLFGPAGVPSQAAPRGPDGEWATVLQAPNLQGLAVDAVMATVFKMLAAA